MDEKSLNQTNVGAGSGSFEQVKGGGGMGIVSPFADAIIKDLPKSGNPTGSIIPKP